MITFEEGKEKVWFRILKVIYIFIFSYIIIFSYSFNKVGELKIDQSRTIIQCNYEDKKSFTPKSINITLSFLPFVRVDQSKPFSERNYSYDYNQFAGDYYEEKVTQDGRNNDVLIRKIIRRCYNKNVEEVDLGQILFTIYPKFTHGYVKGILFILATFCALYLLKIFFYYIISGNVKPKK